MYELPSDLSALASILGAAMVSEPTTEAPRAEVPDRARRNADRRPEAASSEFQVTSDLPLRTDNSELTTDTSQLTTATFQVAGAEPSEGEAAAFDEVARSLAAAEACVPLLAESTGLLRIAALDVVKAETVRAGGLLHLLRFLRGDISPPVTAVSTAAVVQRVVQALESERRLRSIALTTRSSVADATCAGDETLLTNTLLALLLITFASVERTQHARVVLSVTVNEAGEIGLAVSQDHVATPPAWFARAGSDQLLADAEQPIVAVALSAAHRLVGEWGGHFTIAGGNHSSIVTLWLPVSQVHDNTTLPH
jgi:hypothetical protein